MRIRILVYALLALLGVLAALPACAQQEGGVTVLKWNPRITCSEQGRSREINDSKGAGARYALLTPDPYWMGTEGLYTWQEGAATYSFQGRSASPPNGTFRPVAAQKGRRSRREAARAAVRAETVQLAKIRVQIGVLREALDQSVPTQIERCECVGVKNCKYGWVEEDWKKLDNDALTNHNSITPLTNQLGHAMSRRTTTLLRYVPDLGEGEGKSLEQAVDLLRKAHSSYGFAFRQNYEAVRSIVNHNCGMALYSRAQAPGFWSDGDTSWNAALDILEKLAPPPRGKK